ncbi:primosomal protein [Gordonia phage Catfish]|uniref:Helix-turn-helix DNA binding domain protein n=1 Tax=Gordonia phage Catfish TaxID=2301538 RepID=A0A385D0M7_9CAUD|nr:primosomal protein [Gordonia phage Catfish]AXQ51886.1 hypothetical protein SEA_CATFISH_50 [Gordonia phage Catfish]
MAKDRRLYGKFTLDFPDSHKIMPLSDAAFRCLVEATLWSRKQLTDGVLPSRYAVARWSLSVLEELCTNDPENPSLVEVENGYLIHDYAVHQDTREEVEARSARNKAAGQRGGIAKAKRGAKQVASGSLSESLPETETETHKKDTAQTAPKPSVTDPDGFAEWWEIYPKKAGKGQARTAYRKARKAVDAATLLEGAQRYRDDPKRNPEYTKNPATWLNGECWADESTVPVKRPMFDF